MGSMPVGSTTPVSVYRLAMAAESPRAKLASKVSLARRISSRMLVAVVGIMNEMKWMEKNDAYVRCE
jgi:hypothetical protein